MVDPLRHAYGHPLRRRSSRVAVGALPSALFALAACGGGAESPPPSTPASSQAPSTPPSDSASSIAPAPSTAEPAKTTADGPWPFTTLTKDEHDAQLERLAKNPGPLKSNFVPPGKTERYGHAEGIVAATPETVRAKLVDFAKFKDLAGPKFKSVKVVDKQGESTDVYFQLPIMKGMVTIWYITRFQPSRSASGGDVLEGSFVKGNIKGMHIAFTVRPGSDPTSSVLVCDLLLQPNVPAPQSALDEELRDACGDAINALRKTL